MPKALLREQGEDKDPVSDAEHLQNISFTGPEEWAVSSGGAHYILSPIDTGDLNFCFLGVFISKAHELVQSCRHLVWLGWA